ncbi:MAG: hypothetical protein VYC19_10895 [Pseudomonadota bacterium]|jgi:hypothetical protein|nr:hypothetical protein [Pseudomonadota bacterium]MEC9235837.1 hypothetical protein [Pseudomonadota bacterium]MEE3322678.1 hypothetical protein [Pseudomonadota bacterium]
MAGNNIFENFPIIGKAYAYLFNKSSAAEELTLVRMFEKYPLAHKAFQEQENLVGFLGGSMPKEYGDLMLNYANAAEQHIQAEHDDKEAIIVGCILFNASPFTFDDIRRFEEEYSPQVKTVVDYILDGDDKLVEQNPFIAQTIGIVSLVTQYDLQKKLDAGEPADEYAEIQSKEDALPSTLFVHVKKHDAKLYDLLDQAAEKLVQTIKAASNNNGAAPQQQPKI